MLHRSCGKILHLQSAAAILGESVGSNCYSLKMWKESGDGCLVTATPLGIDDFVVKEEEQDDPSYGGDSSRGSGYFASKRYLEF